MSRAEGTTAVRNAGNSVSGLVAAEDGAAIPVTMHGTAGPAVIFVHGWSCGAAFWREQTALADRFRVVTLDLPGHGLAAPARPSRAWSIEQFGRDVVAVADWTGADEVILIGHSMGGAVALEAALELGPRCSLLVGADTFTEAAFYAARPDAEIASRVAAFRGDFAGRMRGMIAAITGDGADPALVRWIGEAMAATDPDAALGVLDALLRWDIMAGWNACATPAVTINSAMLARRNESIDLSGLDIHLMEGVGHFPMLENPRQFNGLLAEILAQHQE